MGHEYKHVLFDVTDEIATITLNRPEAKNALSTEMRDDLAHALDEVKARAGDDVKALILTGADGAFCAGGDVKAMGSRDKSAATGRRRLRDSHATMYDLLHAELPVISLVDGPAAGAGANIALSADFVFATPRAFFLQAFGRIGLVPDWGGFFVLPRIVGLQKAKELVFTARRVYADEAKELGMVYEVVPEADAMAQVREFAGRFRNASTTAIGLAKTILNQSYNSDHRTLLEMEAFAQGVAAGTPYHAEAVQRFRDKQPALFDWDALDRAQSKSAAE